SALVPPSTVVPQKQNLGSPVPARTALPTALTMSAAANSSHTGREGAAAGGPWNTAVATVGTVPREPPCGTPEVSSAPPPPDPQAAAAAMTATPPSTPSRRVTTDPHSCRRLRFPGGGN